MVIFTDQGDMAKVSIGEHRLTLNDAQVTNIWCQLANHYDSGDVGPTNITVAERGIRLSNIDVRDLYDYATAWIEKAFIADELEYPTLH